MKPLYTNTCANCVYLQSKLDDKAHCTKHHIYISDTNVIGKVYCEEFEMEHEKIKRQKEYNSIVSKLVVMSKEEIVDYIANNLCYESYCETWTADFEYEEEK